MYLRLVWDTCKIHPKCQDTCILLEFNRAFKIHLRYTKIHPRYVYSTRYTRDTSGYIRIRILITNPPKLDNKPHRSRDDRRRTRRSRRADAAAASRAARRDGPPAAGPGQRRPGGAADRRAAIRVAGSGRSAGARGPVRPRTPTARTGRRGTPSAGHPGATPGPAAGDPQSRTAAPRSPLPMGRHH